MRVRKGVMVGLRGTLVGLLLVLATLLGGLLGGAAGIGLAYLLVGGPEGDALSYIALAFFFAFLGIPLGAALAFGLAAWGANSYFAKPS